MMTEQFQKHLAALSPYFQTSRYPSTPSSRKIAGAVYLFRHGNLEVSQHDYQSFMRPFLTKLTALQTNNSVFVRGKLAPLSTYRSWITEAHMGMVSTAGLEQSSILGHNFRARYSQLIDDSAPKGDQMSPLLTVWSDSATRCRLSAIAFAEAFSGQVIRGKENSARRVAPIDCRVKIVDANKHPGTCSGLSWHTSLRVDQRAGGRQMKHLMKIILGEALERLQGDWLNSAAFDVEDIYALQLLHCYDVISGRHSAFEHLFTPKDWDAFEYLRDTKYYFSEGYGSDSHLYAVPWMTAVMDKLDEAKTLGLPLSIAFTHREEILYLCCLLGIGYEEGWSPTLERVDNKREWRVSQLAPYLGHVGIECYSGAEDEKRLRIIVNGSVVSAFNNQWREDKDGGYDFDVVKRWISTMPCRWEGFKGL